MEEFIGGGVVGAAMVGLLLAIIVNHNKQEIYEACQGKPWVIEEPLIKKTLTCVVDIKEVK